MNNIHKLYRVSDVRYPHINTIDKLSNDCVLFLCRNPLEWFPTHLNENDFVIYEFTVKLNKIRIFNNHEQKLYFDCFDIVDLVKTKQTNLFKLDSNIIGNEENEYQILSSFGEKLYSQGYDSAELCSPKAEAGEDELEELIVFKPKESVISINVYNY